MCVYFFTDCVVPIQSGLNDSSLFLLRCVPNCHYRFQSQVHSCFMLVYVIFYYEQHVQLAKIILQYLAIFSNNSKKICFSGFKILPITKYTPKICQSIKSSPNPVTLLRMEIEAKHLWNVTRYNCTITTPNITLRCGKNKLLMTVLKIQW